VFVRAEVAPSASAVLVKRLDDRAGDSAALRNLVAVLVGPFPDRLVLVAVRPARGSSAAGGDTAGGAATDAGGDVQYGENLWRRRFAPLLATAVLLVVAYLAVDNLAALYGVTPGTGPARIVPIALVAVFAAGTACGLILRRSKPEVYEGIGRGARSATASASGLSAIL
jgi:hypothetical protein